MFSSNLKWSFEHCSDLPLFSYVIGTNSRAGEFSTGGLREVSLLFFLVIKAVDFGSWQVSCIWKQNLVTTTLAFGKALLLLLGKSSGIANFTVVRLGEVALW